MMPVNEKLRELEHFFNLKFNDFNLLICAMTHSSYANEHDTESNERMEFIGDAVLDLAVGTYLFQKLDEPEGVLTKKRAQEVCEGSLHDYAKSFRLGQYLLLGKGEEKNGGREKSTVLADAFEALIGAVFLDKGYSEVFKILNKVVFPIIDRSLHEEDNDFKSKLQEMVQSDKRTLSYSIVSESGPPHDKEFVARVVMDDVIMMGQGKGKTKKEAEQNAARMALEKMAESKS
ncbi:MAG: ribonuclease III [Acholeplasmataceae bacterium]|jgi:ribonuclease-3|nr:ribonuclease III [Acholeplasmataceae bacterium]